MGPDFIGMARLLGCESRSDYWAKYRVDPLKDFTSGGLAEDPWVKDWSILKAAGATDPEYCFTIWQDAFLFDPD